MSVNVRIVILWEDQLIRYFKVKFKQRRDISGIETFEGDCDEMIDTIHSFISKQNKRQNKTVVPEVVPESFTKSLKNVHEELQTMFIGNYRIHKFEQFVLESKYAYLFPLKKMKLMET